MESPVQTITYHDDIGHGAPESQLQSALEVSCDGYALFDSDERLVHANDGYRNLMDGVGELLLPGIPLSTLINESVRRGTVAEAVETSGSAHRPRLIERRLPHHECVFSHAQQAMVTFPYRRLSSRRAIPPPNRRHGQKGSRKSRDRERAAPSRFRRHCAELFLGNERGRSVHLPVSRIRSCYGP